MESLNWPHTRNYQPLRTHQLRLRRRRGGTSPPLVGVEPNPGPRNRPREKKSKEEKHKKKRRPKLDAFTKGRIIQSLELGVATKEIARRLKVAPKTIRLWKVRYAETGGVLRKIGSGGKRKLTGREQIRIRTMCVRDRRRSAIDIAREINRNSPKKKQIHPNTVRRILKTFGLNGRIAREKPYINDVNKIKRLRWCRAHKDWTLADWRRVLWTDESSIQLIPGPGKMYVWRTSQEVLKPECLAPTVKKGGGKISFWAGFHGSTIGPIVPIKGIMTAEIYEEILTEHTFPYLKSLPQASPTRSEEKTKKRKREKGEEKERQWIRKHQ